MQDSGIKFNESKNPGYQILKLALLRSLPLLAILGFIAILPISVESKISIVLDILLIYLVYFFLVTIPILRDPLYNAFGVYFSSLLTAFFETYIALYYLLLGFIGGVWWTDYVHPLALAYIYIPLTLMIPFFAIVGFIIKEVFYTKLKKQSLELKSVPKPFPSFLLVIILFVLVILIGSFLFLPESFKKIIKSEKAQPPTAEQRQFNDKFTFVKVTNGGSETNSLKAGDTISIQWQGCDVSPKINLQIFVVGIYENGKVVPVEHKAGSYFVAQNIDNKGSGSFSYTIPLELPTAAYKIWASSDNCGAESNEFIYIKNKQEP